MPVMAVHLVSVGRIEFPDIRRLDEVEAIDMGKVKLLHLGDIVQAFEVIISQVVPPRGAAVLNRFKDRINLDNALVDFCIKAFKYIWITMAYLQNIKFYHVFVYKKGVFLYMRSFCFPKYACIIMVINEEKVLAKLEANKAKPKKKSGFMARLAEAQRIQQQQLNERNKSNSTKKKR